MTGLLECAAIALTGGGTAVTVAKSKLFETLRIRVESEYQDATFKQRRKNYLWYAKEWIRCPYCVSHWTTVGAWVVWRPAVSPWPLALLATITVATFIAAAGTKSYNFVAR